MNSERQRRESSVEVTVVVCTYNQELWIRQTLDSILAQDTSYPFEIVIGEDWGSDGTRAICEEYASRYENVRLAPQERNLGIVGNWINCIRQSNGKYIMTCAGDDYWHNPDKIQLQVDFMEQHPECVICHTDIDVLQTKTNTLKPAYKKSSGIVPPEGRIQEELLRGRDHVSAVTMCIRRDPLEQYVPLDKYIELEFPREDFPTLFILSAYGDIRYIPVSTATYRIGQESISNDLNYERIRLRYHKDKIMTEYLYSLFPALGPFKDGPWFDTFVYHSLLIAAYENNDFKAAKRFACKDPKKGIMAKAATHWLSFKLFGYYRKWKSILDRPIVK